MHVRIMRKNPVPDEVVRAVDLDVPDVFQSYGLDGDDFVPEDGADVFMSMGVRAKKFGQGAERYVIIRTYEKLTRKVNERKIEAFFKACAFVCVKT